MKQWYLIYTKPRQELIAVANLQNQAYTAFAPQVSVKKRTNQGWKQVNEPLFPNYVFIQLDDVADDWKPIRSTRGVSGFVRFGSGLPAPISDALMLPLLALDWQQVSEQLSIYPKVGDRVNVSIGETWVSALVTADDAKGRVEVLLNLLGQEQSLWVDSHRVKTEVF
jgi:transcriptional antiterminator RfaH